MVDGAEQILYVHAPSWARSMSTDDSSITYLYNNRMYLSTVDYLDTTKYFAPNLLGGVMEYDVDLSQVSCGCVSAIYQTLMPAVNHTTDPFGYCDAN